MCLSLTCIREGDLVEMGRGRLERDWVKVRKCCRVTEEKRGLLGDRMVEAFVVFCVLYFADLHCKVQTEYSL